MEWLILLVPALVLALRSRASRRRGAAVLRETGPAWRRTYSRRGFLRLGAAVLVAGAAAYGGLDEEVESAHARRLRSRGSDLLSLLLKSLGERIWFGVWALVAAIEASLESAAATRWGRRNFQAMLVGLPLLWGLQRLLGASRPGQRPHGPRWDPLASDKSASGHAFIGAVPWLNLARRAPGGLGRAAAVAGSTLTGWSRLNDGAHYPSQIFLGWFIAWLATDGVAQIEPRQPEPPAPVT